LAVPPTFDEAESVSDDSAESPQRSKAKAKAADQKGPGAGAAMAPPPGAMLARPAANPVPLARATPMAAAGPGAGLGPMGSAGPLAAVGGAGAAAAAAKGERKRKKEFDHESGSEAESEDDEPVEAQARPAQAKLYNAADYKHLLVTQEVQELFDYIGRYKPHDVELDTKLRPFIPDYIPAVGDIDPFLKVPRPDESKELLGLTELDEPAAHQSDPTVLELTYRAVSRKSTMTPVTVRSIEHADKNPKKVTSWISSIEDIHRKKPPANVVYSKPMPDIEQLMQVWPAEFEQLLKDTPLPSADLNMSVEQYARVVCALLDIPVYDKVVESLHVLFTLYSEFKTNAHLNRAE